jgi:hypothetical protein
LPLFLPIVNQIQSHDWVAARAVNITIKISRYPLCAAKEDVMRDVSPSKKQPKKTAE